MKYNYDAKYECFVREDGLGKKFYINSSEAHRIMTMHGLGNSVGEIRNKIRFSNPRKVTESTILNFIKNVNEGNIELSDDLPTPVNDVLELSLESRITRLEERISVLEDGLKHKEESKMDKVKSWIKGN